MDQAVFVANTEKRNGIWETKFSIEGMKCQACVNKIKQHVYQLYSHSSMEANLTNKSISLCFAQDPGSLKELFSTLVASGFTPKPYHNKRYRQELIQLGVAGYAAGNVMLLTLADYFSTIEPPFDLYFRVMSLLIASFSLAFASSSLWQNAISGFRAKKVDIDSVILLGIISAYFYSMIQVALTSHGEVYFDSITVVLFLILVGRFIRNRSIAKVTSKINEDFVRDPHFCLLIEAGIAQTVPVSQIKAGDILKIRPGDIVPVEAKVIEGEGYIDLSSINGEVERLFSQEGTTLPSGAYSINNCLTVQTLKAGGSGYISQAEHLTSYYLDKRSNWQGTADRVAFGFMVTLLSITSILIVFQVGGSSSESIRRSISLLLIACPCALGFALPLAIGQIIVRLSQKGVVVQNTHGLENLYDCKEVVFDKTGTLTRQNLEMHSLKLYSNLEQVQSLALALGTISHHHICQTFCTWAKKQPFQASLATLTQAKEILGQGVEGTYNKKTVRFGKATFACDNCKNSGQVHLSINGECAATFDLEETLSPNASETIQQVKDRNMGLHIVSGDTSENASKIASKLRIPSEAVFSEQTPQTKLDHVFSKNHMVVGNGLNDILAFAGSKVSIAVFGSQPLARKKADFYLSTPGVGGVQTIFTYGDILRKKLRRVYLFSFLYNTSALAAAVCGYVSPIVAAALMPLSSFVIINLAVSFPKEVK